MEQRVKLSSLAISFVSIACLSLLVFLAFKSRDDMARLNCQNDSERSVTALLDGMREHENFGEIIEANEGLKATVIGVGIYAASGSMIYGWGDYPESYRMEQADAAIRPGSGRGFIDDPKTDSFILLVRPSRMAPHPPPGGPEHQAPDPAELERMQRRPKFFETLSAGSLVYLELREPAYWRENRLRALLLPFLVALIAAGVLFVRSVYLSNLEYRRRFDEQKSLVILGTAASTLAHEIKTPIMSIRLQTGILEKLFPGTASKEIGIINSEIERLSLLSYRVNDYLREPKGNPALIDPAMVAREVGQRMFGRDIVTVKADSRVSMDPERLRSALENLLRNAAESGSPEDSIVVETSIENGISLIDVLDRGQGISSEDKKKLFKTFFTTKSRGSGIGLTICQRFVESAGGTISLDGRPDGGARARVSLPEAKR
jgi:two-component system, NtrC family, sensor histidine kinase HydH